ncbi:MAG: hypothetical protein KFW09_01605 [Oscillospiraceae bacterium]|nr:hypothetical protein [Oscillospiraceae bacterium]
MVDFVKEKLDDIQKNLEKMIISKYTASSSYNKSENIKNKLEKNKIKTIQELNSNIKSYTNNFSTSAKGKWVIKAEKSFLESTKEFNSF